MFDRAMHMVVTKAADLRAICHGLEHNDHHLQ